MTKPKMRCEVCGVKHRTTNVILYHGKYTCFRCRPKTQNLPTTKTLLILQKVKKAKVFKFQ